MNLRTARLLIGLPCTPDEVRPAIPPGRWGGSKRKARLVIAAAFLAIAVAPLRATTITVTTTNDNGPGSLRAACANLDAFIFNVEVQTWWRQIWPPSCGERLVRNALRIRNVLGCDGGFGPGHH